METNPKTDDSKGRKTYGKLSGNASDTTINERITDALRKHLPT